MIGILTKLTELNKEWLDKSRLLLDTHDKINGKLTEISKKAITYELEVQKDVSLKNKDARESQLKLLKNSDEDILSIRNNLSILNLEKKYLEIAIIHLDAEMKNIRSFLRSKESD